MHQAIASAATRKLDLLRAQEKALERERQLEGDEFADKEKFVTQAYKDQMEEVRRAEEGEKKREGWSLLSRRPGPSSCGLTSVMLSRHRVSSKVGERRHLRFLLFVPRQVGRSAPSGC